VKITVKVFDGNEELTGRVFDEGVYRIGRSEFSDLVLAGESVSRSHLELRVTEAAVYMTNMTTAGKVKLNGKARETGEIADGDEIGIGPYRLVIFHGERDAAAPPELPGEAAAEAPPDEMAAGGDPQPEIVAEAPPAFDAPGAEGEAQFQAEGGAAEAVQSISRGQTQLELKPVVAKLMFVDGPRKGEELFLETYEVSFGRSKRADIYLDDPKLSRIHAKITRVGMGYRLIDMNSRNGTYVNGMRVLEHPLASFDEIELGSTKIKFLIHDVLVSQMQRGALAIASEATSALPAPGAGGEGMDQTRSIQVDLNALGDGEVIPPERPGGGPAVLGGDFEMTPPQQPLYKVILQDRTKRNRLLMATVGLLLVVFILLPSGNGKKAGPKSAATTTQADKGIDASKLPPSLPKEYAELSPDAQRIIEGNYNSALKAAEQENFEEAVSLLKKIHEQIPYYKQSRDLLDTYSKRLREAQIQQAQDKAKKDEKQDLAIYLDEGLEYLKEGDFDRAAESFNSAIVIDPNNKTATLGLKAAEMKIKDINQIPPEKDPEEEKRKLVADLFQKAVAAFTNKSYQEAIDTAEKIRQVEIKGDTQYLNEAKQIIDRAKMLQKEEFEPFLIQAKEKYAEGDYNASRDLCEEMLKRDSSYEEAKDCVLKAKKQLNRLAKEAYQHGYILESMNRIEEAKQYWNRARNYVRAGDEYYDKVNRKLDYYQ
jgi:pSer/pThr/pTyr-binding forkhead associated (FHA) protein/tetratricopeptide (TPR) repeat protein